MSLLLAWPLLVYVGLEQFGVRGLALLLLLAVLARALLLRETSGWAAVAGTLLLAGVALAADQLLPLLLYPVLVNALLLTVFAASLRAPPTVIERLARLRQPDLPAAAVHYTRRVTQVWCGFFVLNGSLALATALFGTPAQWAFYNGFVAYLLMGLLFGGEWLVRQRVQADQRHG